MEKSQRLLIQNLIRLRTKHKKTQDEASKIAGVGVKTYQKYEYGKVFPSKETISKIASGYEINEADLFKDPKSKGEEKPISEMTETDIANIFVKAARDMAKETASKEGQKQSDLALEDLTEQETELLSLFQRLPTKKDRDAIIHMLRSRLKGKS